MRNDIVCGALAPAFVVGDLAVPVVRIRVLEDYVPGVEQAGEEAKTAERNVDQRVAGADTTLDPDCITC